MNKHIFSIEIIKQKFGIDKRHSRTLCQMATAMLKCRTSNMAKIAEYMDDKQKSESIYRKLQRFVSRVNLEENICAEVLTTGC